VDGKPTTFAVFADVTDEIGVAALLVSDEDEILVFVLTSAADIETFQANARFLGTIVDTVRIPAESTPPPPSEQGGSDGQPGLPGLGNNQDDASGGVPGLPGLGGQSGPNLPKRVKNAASTFAFSLPENWATTPDPAASPFFFGADQGAIDAFSGGTNQAAPAGAYFLTPKPADQSTADAYDSVFGTATFETITTNSGMIGNFEGQWAEGTLGDLHGYWIAVNFGDQLGVMILTTPESRWQEDQPLLRAIFQSMEFSASGLQ
jgi:hypothetical protein